MQLQTPRLLLLEVGANDLDHIHNLNSIPAVDQYNTLGIPENISVTEAILNEWLRQQSIVPKANYVFCIANGTPANFVGMIGLRLGKPNYRIAEIWYKLHPHYWGLGYATEALLEILRFGFQDMGLHRIEAGCAVENAGSIKVLEKAGMLREGRSRQILPIRGKWVDNFTYAILEDDFGK